jgi:peptidylprolyl isomerase
MRIPLRSAVTLLVLLALPGCRLKEEAPPAGSEGPKIPAPSDVAAPPADALKTPSGLASKVIRVGLGEVKPTLRSRVTVHYTGWTTDGQMFDSSVARGEPVEFEVPRVIEGWQEALQLMRVGEKRRFWIPGRLAYDNLPDPPAGVAPPNPKGMLVFDIELLNIK